MLAYNFIFVYLFSNVYLKIDRGVMIYKSKIGRNEPCWCGSNTKYKKCHFERDKQKPLEHWEAGKEFNRLFSKKTCSCPESLQHECDQKIIRAHTVPKSSSLKSIANDGHVLGLKISLENIRKNKGNPVLERIGINNASVFNGFCKKHDDAFFASIEKGVFLNTPEQCFFLAYRAFSREFYLKASALDASNLFQQADKGKPFDTQMEIQMNRFSIDLGSQIAMNDLKYHKQFFDSAIINRNYSSVRAVVFSLDAIPPIMVCGGVNPDYNFKGELIQDLMDFENHTDSLYVTSFFDGVEGKVVFSWLKNSHNACQNLISSLLEKDKEDWGVYIVQYIVKNFENFFIDPVWWGNVGAKDASLLLDIIKDTVSLNKMPSAFGINKKVLDVDFPKINKVDFVNWGLEAEEI